MCKLGMFSNYMSPSFIRQIDLSSSLISYFKHSCHYNSLKGDLYIIIGIEQNHRAICYLKSMLNKREKENKKEGTMFRSYLAAGAETFTSESEVPVTWTSVLPFMSFKY